eukprot:14267-Heterococcus_DN1.PRE.2
MAHMPYVAVAVSGVRLQSFVQQLLETEKSQRQRFSGLLARSTAATTATIKASSTSANATATDADGTVHIGKMVTSVSPLDEHGAIVRFAAEKTEDIYRFLHKLLAPLEHILGTQLYATDY